MTKWLWACALAAVWPMLAQAQTPNLEELEAQLKREQAAEAAQKAEAQRRSEAARRLEASMGKLVLEADAACEVRIDGERKVTLQPGAVETISVMSGQQLVDCISTEFPEAKVRQVVEVQAGQKLVVTLALAVATAKARQAQEQQVAEAQRQREAQAADEAMLRRFSDLGDGTIRDNDQNLIWASRDNGSDIDWAGARQHCAARGTGWSLPTVAQLQSLYDASGRYARGVSLYSQTINVKLATPLISPTGLFYWSSEQSVPSEAWTSVSTVAAGTRTTCPTPTTYGRCVYVVPEHGAGSFGHSVI